MKNKKNYNKDKTRKLKNNTIKSGKIDKDTRIDLVKSLYGDTIYEHYLEKKDEFDNFKSDVVSHIKFIQKLAQSGFKEKDLQKLNGIVNFCESFLIRNHLSNISKNENQ